MASALNLGLLLSPLVIPRRMAEPNDAALAELVLALHDSDWKVVTQAQRDLARVGAPALAPLCELLDADYRVAWRAAWVLGRLNDRHAVPYLSAKLLELGRQEAGMVDDPQNRRALLMSELAEGLGALNHPEGTKALCVALASPHAIVLKHASAALEGIGSAAVAELCASLGRLPAKGLAAAALLLGKKGDARTVGPLCSVLNHSDWTVRLRATEALGVIAPRYPVLELRAAIPHLERNQRGWNLMQQPLRAASKRTLLRIEAATDHLQHVPLPASSPPSERETLPVPAGSIDNSDLHISHDRYGVPQHSPRVTSMMRLRKWLRQRMH